jgi:hypothetical protein
MDRMARLALFSALAALALAACSAGSGGQTAVDDASALAGKGWVLESYSTSDGPLPLLDGARTTIEFNLRAATPTLAATKPRAASCRSARWR